MGAMPGANRPASIAAAARKWLLSAKASCASRLTSKSLATASAVSPIPQYQSGLALAMRALGTIRHPPKGIGDIDSIPPAKMQSARPA